jgi:hypothetical protein
MIWMEDETLGRGCVGGGGWGGGKDVVSDSATRYCCPDAPLAPRGINSPMGSNEENNANHCTALEQELSDAKW